MFNKRKELEQRIQELEKMQKKAILVAMRITTILKRFIVMPTNLVNFQKQTTLNL